MENKITLKTEAPTLILAQRLKKIKQRLTNCKSIEEEDITELDSIIYMMESQERYLDECTSLESSDLSKLNKLTMQTDWDQIFLEKKSKVRLMTQMMSSKLSGQLLKMLVTMSGAKKILELGLFSGYSALAMAEGLPRDGRLISCEIDPYAASFARSYLDGTSYGKKIQIRVGPALNLLDNFMLEGESFDFVFIDAKKTEYKKYITKIIANKLITKRSILCIDNVFMKGACFSKFEKQTKGSNEVKQMNQLLTSEKFFTVMLPVRDGMTISKLR
ncbi:MAG: hypothetical protein CM15mP58_17060 [Burkholderiaceae bacterium]|nr:MAG: hypothetical protein CM15mP58_17060 [Burkholderiaceae bacterium]